MNKKLFKLGALTLGLFGAVIMLSANAQTTSNGDVSLTITGGTTECKFVTGAELGTKDVSLETGYTFTGKLLGEWRCSDYKGITGGWTMSIAMSGNLVNESNNSISGNHVSVQHPAGQLSGTSTCQRGTAAVAEYRAIDTSYTIIERSSLNPTDEGICSITIPTVDIKVDVDAFQAPGKYTGTFVVTLTNINSGM